MIGSHDSFTYLNPIHNIFKLFKFLWRTQTKTITEQYNYGVRYFDIRVKYKRNRWYICHGLVIFNVAFASLKHIIDFFNLHYPGSKLRIIYEKGNFEDIFKQEIRELLDNETLSYACIKSKWKVLVNKDPIINDYTYRPFLSDLSLWENIKRMNLFSTIKKWAKKHNPKINKDIINNNILYFMDYI